MADSASNIGAGTAVPAPRDAVTAAKPSITNRNIRLQHLRGVAALLVLLYHSGEYIWRLRGEQSFHAIFPGYLGVYGVATFFVLSGYLMAQLSERTDAARFLLDRILRIYPLMLLIGAGALLLYAATGFARRPDLLSLTLIPVGSRDYLLGVEWTLLFEMSYYAIIAAGIMLGCRRWLVHGAAVWLALLAVASLTSLAPAATLMPTLSQLFGQPANAPFLMGFLLPAVLARGWLPSPLWLLGGAVASLGLFPIAPEAAARWVGGVSALLLVAAAVTAPRASARGALARFWIALGDSSYALYLCHVSVMLISAHLIPTSVPAWALWTFWCTASIGIALVLGSLDLRLHGRLKHWVAGLPGPRVKAVALAYLAVFAGIALAFDLVHRAGAKAERQARAALSQGVAGKWPDVLTDIDSHMMLPDGRLILRGYGIDLSKPASDAFVAIQQGGQVIGFDSMTRMRPQVAAAANRPDIAKIRFGFGVVTDAPLDCTRGPIEAKLVLPGGRVTPIASDALSAICARAKP